MSKSNLATCLLCPYSAINQPGFKRGACACIADPARRDIKELARSGECAKGYLAGGTPQVVELRVPAPRRREWGPMLWARLHTAKDADAAWLDDFTASVPAGECQCRAHWREILQQIPPVFGDGWFEWTVRVHNAVNRKLGKPEMELAGAVAKWVVEKP